MNPSDGVRARALFPTAAEEDEAFILRFAREAPLLYGTWRHVKGLYKESESAVHPAVLGTLIGRLDGAAPTAAAENTEEALQLSGVNALAADPPYACISTWDGLVVLDFSNPDQPRVLGRKRMGRCKRVAISGRRILVEEEGGRGVADRVHLLEVDEAGPPDHFGFVEVRSLKGLAVEGSHLFLSEGVGGQRGRFRIFDISAPEHPVQLSTLELPDAAGIALANGRAYVATTGGRNVQPGLHVVDVADPRSPRHLGFYRLNCGGMLVGSTYLESPQRSSRLAVVDPSVPPPPVPPAAAPPPAAPPGLLRRIVEIVLPPSASPPAEPAPQLPHWLVDLWRTDGIYSTTVRRGYAYVAFYYGGVQIVALSGADGPRLLDQVSAPSTSHVVATDDQLYLIPQHQPVQRFELSQPGHPARLGTPPKAVTFDYMQRRARRALRKLAVTDPDRFAETAFHALVEAGREHPELDPARQWVSTDLLYGGSGRYVQQRHGRGAYVARWTGTRRRTREERGAEAWNRRPDLALALCTQPNLPWQTYETMLKVLQANRVELPELSAEVRLRYLRSPSPLLTRVAARQAAVEIEAGGKPDAEVAARAYFFSPAGVRARLAARLYTRAGSPAWARPFAVTLTGLVAESLGAGPVSRRVLQTADLLTRGFAPFVSAERLLPLAERLVNDGSPELLQLVLAGFRTVPPAGVGAWLEVWTRLPESVQGPAWDALAAGLRRSTLSEKVAWELVTASDEAVRQAAWRLLLVLSPPAPMLKGLWDQLLALAEDVPALQTAIGSAAALALLRRSGLQLDTLAERVSTAPSLAGLFSPEAMEALTAAVPVEGLFVLIGAISEARWPELRGAVLEGLRASGRLAAFWKAAPAALTDAGVQTRLLDDPGFAGSLLEVEEASLIEITDAPFEALLHQWAAAHPQLFPAGSSTLAAAATHPLPAVREWGLTRVRDLGMTLPFALRLLESDVPPSVALGRAFILALPPGDPDELSYALALCDSPERGVRAFGREFLEARRESLPALEAVRSLSEHGDAEMNHFLAELLTRPGEAGVPETARPAAEVRAFDRGVLRARNRGRRAKEQVKVRLSRAGEPDLPLLLELARSGTPRDAEWALAELARLAASGQAVDGVTVEGPAGV